MWPQFYELASGHGQILFWDGHFKSYYQEGRGLSRWWFCNYCQILKVEKPSYESKRYIPLPLSLAFIINKDITESEISWDVYFYYHCLYIHDHENLFFWDFIPDKISNLIVTLIAYLNIWIHFWWKQRGQKFSRHHCADMSASSVV